MRLNVLTAVSRPENLALLADSLAIAVSRSNVRVIWRWLFDLERENVGGQAIKNTLLDEVPDGEWVWIVDDDTLVHEEILRLVEAFPSYDAVVFSQTRSDGRVLPACQENVGVGGIDIGQAFLRRELIGKHRIPLDYNGDGMFLAAVLAPTANVLYHPAALSLHNAISRVEVSV